MAHYEDEMNQRRQRREAQRQKQLQEQKRMKLALIAAAVVLVLGGFGIWKLAKNPVEVKVPPKETRPAATAPKETEAPAPTQRSTTTTIHLKAAGDLNITNASVDAGVVGGGFNYTRAFMDVASILADADLTLMNFEGTLSGEPYGTGTRSAPPEMLEGLRNAGVDMLQMANSCSIYNGLIGLTTSLQRVRNSGIMPLGAFQSPAEFQQTKGYSIAQVHGIKIAFVAFTKGVGGMGMPSGNEDCVNLLYKDYATTYNDIDKEGITAILKNVAAEKPDITVALLHWGSEYNDVISETQEDIVSLMQKQGVDIIFGTHPHLLQKVEFDKTAGTLVAYSLGDFFGDAVQAGTNYSIILDVEITKDSEAGTTKVTDFSYTPIYTLTNAEAADGKRRVVRIDSAMDAYTNNYVDKISTTAYNNMAYALTRIEARVKGE